MLAMPLEYGFQFLAGFQVPAVFPHVFVEVGAYDQLLLQVYFSRCEVEVDRCHAIDVAGAEYVAVNIQPVVQTRLEERIAHIELCA